MQARPLSLIILNIVMLVGVAPITACGYYYRILHPHAGGIPLAINVFYSYMCALLLAGGAALLSWRITRQRRIAPGAVTLALRYCALAAVIVPFFFA